MKFPRIIHAVYQQPWLITPQAHAAIRTLVESRLAGLFNDFDVEESEPTPPYSVHDGVGIISVDGTILRKATALEKMCGAVGVEEIAAGLVGAAQDPNVRAIALDIDSPGGTVGGVPELGALVASIREQKTVMAYTAGQMCSAAYWLASGASEIIAAPSAEVGSIGVYMPWHDESKRYEQAGVKAEVIRNTGADLKGMGYPGTSLTESQRQHLQEGVDAIAEMFHNAVRLGRVDKVITEDTMRGQAFLAAEAQERGLIDGTEPTFADAVHKLRLGFQLTRKD